MKAKKSKYTELRGRLQAKFREVGELRTQYAAGVREVKRRAASYLIAEAQLAEQIGKHDAARAALDKETTRLEGVYQSRLQQLRNELAQTAGQLDTAHENARRGVERAILAEQSEDEALSKLGTERKWTYALAALLVADTLVFHVPYAELAKALGL